MMFRSRVSLFIFAFVFVLALAGYTPIRSQETGQLTAEKWREDLRFFAAEIERSHKNAFHSVSRSDFQRAVAELDSKIPSLEEHQVIAGLMRLTAMIGDGHTGMRWGRLASSGVFPVSFYWFDEGIYVRVAAPEHADIVGSRVVSVGDAPVDEAIKRLRPLIWRDNEMGVKSSAPNYLSVPQLLYAVGITSAKDRATFTFEKDGRQFVRELRGSAKLTDLFEKPPTWVDARTAEAVPLYARDPRNRFWFAEIPSTRTFYIQFNEVQHKGDETIDAFFARAFAAAEKGEFDRLVLDIRNNGGGNNYLNIPIITGAIRSRFNNKGKFFVIIGRETFSAAQNAVNDLEKYTNAIFVGEPTGASPNHYGDARRFTLPNSKLIVQASTLWWQDMDPRDTRPWKAPDVAADMTFAAYKAGRDLAMEAIYNYKPAESLDEIIASSRASLDVKGFIDRVESFRSNPAHKYVDTLVAVNRAGHFLLRNGRTQDALAVFEMNAKHYPESATVYQSLGDCYDIMGDRTKALENYRKAVAIDPSLLEAAEAIRRLSSTVQNEK